MTADAPATEYLLRSATSEECQTIVELVGQAFGQAPDQDTLTRETMVFEPERDHVIVYDGRLVANLGAYTREITVPGGVLPAAHVTSAGVKSEHRRRGLLTRLIHHQFQTMPESIAVLWASEARIYQRFGYGMAAHSAPLDIDTREVSLAAFVPPGSGRVVDAVPVEAREDLVKLYDRVRTERPGWSARDGNWWDRMILDSLNPTDGLCAKRLSLYATASGITGYALWRCQGGWDDGRPNGEVRIIEVVAATPEAYAELWRHLLSVDLTRRATLPYGAVDEPLQFLVSDPRLLHPKVKDGLWLRLVDLPAALAGRCYSAPVDVVFEITDELLPANAGRFRLRAAAGGTGCCERTEAPADLACDVAALAAGYLGGVSLTRLADAGRISELRPGALATASVAFGWHRAPAPSEMF